MERYKIESGIGKRLRQVRDHFGYGVVEMQLKVGIRSSSISHWERELFQPQSRYIYWFVKNHNVDPLWIFTGKGSMFLSEDDPGLIRRGKEIINYIADSKEGEFFYYFFMYLFRNDCDGLLQLILKAFRKHPELMEDMEKLIEVTQKKQELEVI